MTPCIDTCIYTGSNITQMSDSVSLGPLVLKNGARFVASASAVKKDEPYRQIRYISPWLSDMTAQQICMSFDPPV